MLQEVELAARTCEKSTAAPAASFSPEMPWNA
eukprot:SAG22_NODE_14322_length_377_cov_1.669065_1_plen_31_part_10